jgi:DNA-binding response OmpR family regulator
MTALLLAEPEATMRGFLERQLSSDGFDVLAFSSTDELPFAADPDVLVLGDPEALEHCLVKGCPVIVLGSADAETRLRALEQCDDYLSRPFVYEELGGVISRAGKNLISSSMQGFLRFRRRLGRTEMNVQSNKRD